MNLRTFSLFVMAFGILSGCTKGCDNNQTPTPTNEQTADSTDVTSEAPQEGEQAVPSDQNVADMSDMDANETTGAVASAE